MISRLWRVTLHEYRLHVWDKGFLVAILSVPLLIAAMVILGVATDYTNVDRRPVGYVDRGGWVKEPMPPAPEDRSALGGLLDKTVQIVPYVSEQDARPALDAGEIQAYYVLGADYPQNRGVELVYSKPPGKNATSQFREFLRLNLLAGYPHEIVQRAEQGASLVVRTPDGSNEFSDKSVLSVVLPLLMSMMFMMLFMATASTLMQAVVQEKDNRTMEILATSVSPGQVIGGKILAVVGMGLTLLVSWILLASGALVFADRVLDASWARGVTIQAGTLRTIVAVAVPSYVLYCGLMATLGSTVADVQESQQMSGLVILIMGLPFYAIVALIEQPNSPLALVLSLFPLTALTSMSLRASFGVVPDWQLVTSVLILVGCSFGSIWLAARAFRVGMLRYGKRLDWRELFGRTRPPAEVGVSDQGGER